MIRLASALSPLALLAAVPLAAQDARDFQLPAATPTPDTRVQGPIDPDAPVPVRPRVIETARPTPTAPPTSSPAPRATAPTIDLRAPPPAPVTRADAARARAQAAQPTASTPLPTLPDAAVPAGQTGLPPVSTTATTPAASPTPADDAPTAIATSAAPEGAPVWPWLALVAAVLAAGLWLFGKRRKADATQPAQIEIPVVPASPVGAGEMIAIAVEAVRMDRSVMNATVNYRVTIRNRTAQALTGVAVEADLVSASNDRPTEQQLASPAQALTPRHTIERLAPGQSMRVEGQVRLPLSEASAIWQGRAALLVPLLRVRATATDAAAVATTLVIGRSEGQAARPQPFRLDEPPRSYAPLAQRVLDAIPARV